MRLLTIILLFLLILSCSSTKHLSIEKNEGKYLWESGYGVVETLEIKSDSTFIFTWVQGLMSGKTLGKIERLHDQLILSSQRKPTVDFDLEIPPQTNQDYYEIRVGDKRQDWFVGANCLGYLNGEIVEGTSTDEMGVCKIMTLDIDTLVVSYTNYKDAILPVEKNKTPKSLMVKLKIEDHYHYFEKEVIKLINKKTIKLETFGRVKVFKRRKNE